MKRSKLQCMAYAVAMSALSVAAATPQVSEVTIGQPFQNRDVAISYTLANAPAVVTLDIQTNAVVDGVETWASIGGEHIKTFAPDCPVFRRVEGDGEKTIVWKAEADWPGFRVSGARAVVTAWAMNDTPDYMVVDISSSAAADSQRYYTATNFLPGGLLADDAYRTTKLVMRRIHAKNIPWTMGSLIETDRQTDKEAPHAAVLTHDSYLGVFPVTQAQWANVTGYNNSSYNTASDRDLHPVEQVCYNEIRCASGNTTAAAGGLYPAAPYEGSFLHLLNNRTMLDFDLPTEGEWEFACRVGGLIGDGRWNTGAPRLVIGDAADANMPGANSHNGYSGHTAEVGLFAPNAWGLYDMHGNVWEWCLDNYKADVSAFAGRFCDNAGSKQRVQRGGCAATKLQNNRTANRAGVAPANRLKWYGLRLKCRAGLK